MEGLGESLTESSSTVRNRRIDSESSSCMGRICSRHCSIEWSGRFRSASCDPFYQALYTFTEEMHAEPPLEPTCSPVFRTVAAGPSSSMSRSRAEPPGRIPVRSSWPTSPSRRLLREARRIQSTGLGSCANNAQFGHGFRKLLV